jgi:hypothetical protein
MTNNKDLYKMYIFAAVIILYLFINYYAHKINYIKTDLPYGINDIEEKTKLSDNVIRAKIVKIKNQHINSEEMPMTEYKIEVLENYKGTYDENYVYQYGGYNKKNHISIYSKDKFLKNDTEYILFIKDNKILVRSQIECNQDLGYVLFEIENTKEEDI